MSKNLGILKREDTALVVIDVQEKLGAAIPEIGNVVNNTNKLIKACKILNVPIIFTEQYPKGLGKTVVEGVTDPIEKIHFDCFLEEKFYNKVKNFKNLIIAGIEAHVCVIQTIISGISRGFKMHFIVDAVSSRKHLDKDVAVLRAKQQGALLATTEMIIFQLLKKAGTPEFKEISEIIKKD
ncbi:isochorismatase family protein [Candidatus Woesearchaeota archaeon]|nr:isochorismatase family protein [Candidatus Woesearchaeota archaeon]